MRFSPLFLRRGGPPRRTPGHWVFASSRSIFLLHADPTPSARPGRSKPAALQRTSKVRPHFDAEKYAANSRLELIFLFRLAESIASQSQRRLTARTRRRDSRLEFWAFETVERVGRWILVRRSAKCGPNREMLPLPAIVPGGFICSSK